MIQLTFNNGLPNTQLEIGDLIYYISNPNTNYGSSGFISGDDTTTGVSNMVLMGTVASITKTNNTDPSPDIALLDDPYQFKIFIEEVSTLPAAPQANDFIFFIKNKSVEQSSVKGYYNSVTFQCNSKSKAELFAVSCDVNESSK